jgi:Polyketide cyclase / dehydrase and lipid transport
MMSGIKRFRRALGYAALAALALAGMAAWSHAANQAGSNVMSMKSDLANREKDIHWPQGFDPSQADLFSHNELLINASCARIWSHIIDANKWPEWYPNAREVKITGDTVLKDGTMFRWTTFGLPIESKVNEFTPYTRIGWYGYAPGTAPSFYHTWYLKTRGDACLVVTDEVGKGKDAVHLRETDQGLMHRGHDLWLATLKWVSEGK